MSDALTIGSQRLAISLENLPLGTPWPDVRVAIAADPGVKALVEFVEGIAELRERAGHISARAALKLWERGDE